MYTPIKYNDIAIGISYSDDLGGYYVANENPTYYLAQTELFVSKLNNQIMNTAPIKSKWLNSEIITRRFYGDSPYTDIIPHHVQIVGNRQYLETDIIGISNKRIIFDVDNISVDILVTSDKTPAQIVSIVTSYLDNIDARYRDAFQFVNGRFLITTQTPTSNKPEAFHNFITIGTGTANVFLGFENSDYALGDLPVEYDKFESFVLLYKKDDTLGETQKSVYEYVPVADSSNLASVSMNEFYSDIISKNERLSALFNGLSYGLDLVESEIDKIISLMDVDNIDEKFLNQLAYNLGFSLPILGDITTDTKRDFLRNLMYLYKTKGNTESFLSVFRYLYYDANIIEKNSDSDNNYPQISISVSNSDISEYYGLFVKSDMLDNIASYNWDYIDKITGEQVSFRRWNTYQIVGGFESSIWDLSSELQKAFIETSKLETFDLSSDYGILITANNPSPAFSEGETLYVESVKLGTVVSILPNKKYKIQYDQNALQNVPHGNITGTMGGGGSIPSAVLSHEPNNKLVVAVDSLYSVFVDFNNYSFVFLNGPRSATLFETYTAIKMAILEQNIPIDIYLSGTQIVFSSKLFGDNTAIECIQGNTELGILTGTKSENTQTVKQVKITSGSIYIPINGVYTKCYLQHNVDLPIDSDTEYILAILADANNVNSVMIITNKELGENKNVALVALTTWNSGKLKFERVNSQEDYRIPYIDEIDNVQYSQIETYVDYRDSHLKYWNATGTTVEHPWTPPDLNTYKDLGKSIFVNLVLDAFDSNRIISKDDITRALWFVEFLRPVYAVISMIFKIQSESENIIGLPMQLESLPEYDTLGNYPIYYWDDTAFGAAIFDAFRFSSRNAVTNFQQISGFVPALIGGEFTNGDVISPFNAVVIDVDTPGNSIIVEDPTYSWNWPYAGTVTNQGSGITYTYTALSPYSLKTTPEVTTSPLPAAGTNNYLDMDGSKKTNPKWGMSGVDAIVNVPNRFSEYFYPHLWDRSAAALPDILNGELTQYDLVGTYPIWDISPEGSTRIDFVLESSTLLPQVSVSPTSGYIEAAGYNFTAYKPESDIRTGDHEDIWPRSRVHIVDTADNDFYGYVRWVAGYPSGTGEPVNRMYIYQDIRGKELGWGGTPLSTIKKLEIYKITLWDGGIADKVELRAIITESDSILTPPVDIYADSLDSFFSGLNFEITSVINANTDLPSNRTFGWDISDPLVDDTMYNFIKESDAITVIKDEVDTTTTLLASTSYTYTPTTGIVQYVAANLSSVYVGSYFVDDLSIVGDEKLHTILGVDDAADQIQLRPNMNISAYSAGNNGIIYGTTLKKNSVVDSLFSWNELAGAFDLLSTYNQLTPIQILALNNAGDIYYGHVDYEITRGFSVTAVSNSIVDNYDYGIFHLGMV